MAGHDIPLKTLRLLRRLSLRQIVYFVELERSQNFGRAAKQLAVSQPTLSQQISQLEATLGTTLINRRAREFELTSEGEYFLTRAKFFLNYLGDTVDSMGERKLELPLRIGIPSYMSYPVVNDILRGFRQRHPSIFPHLVEIPAVEMCEHLADKRLDAGFLSLPAPDQLSAQMASKVVWQAPYMLCLSKRDPLSKKHTLAPEDVARIDIILIPREKHPAHYDFQLAGLRSLGIEPRIAHSDVTNTQSQMGLVSAGVGVCLVSAGTITLPDDLVLRGTSPELYPHQLGLFWQRRSLNPLLDRFVGYIRSLPEN